MDKQQGSAERSAEREPVQAFREWPDGPPIWIHKLIDAAAPVTSLRVGTGPFCEVPVTPKEMPHELVTGELHCFLDCAESGITVREYRSAGPTLLNEIPVAEAEVRPGNVLTIGTVQLVAYGNDLERPPDITAADMPTLIRKAQTFHGKSSKVADALKVSRQTFYGWVKKGKYGLAAVVVACLAVGGLYWSQSPETARGQERATPAASAAPQTPTIADKAGPESKVTDESPESSTTPEPVRTEPPESESAPKKKPKRHYTGKPRAARTKRPAKAETEITPTLPEPQKSKSREIRVPFKFGRDLYTSEEGR